MTMTRAFAQRSLPMAFASCALAFASCALTFACDAGDADDAGDAVDAVDAVDAGDAGSLDVLDAGPDQADAGPLWQGTVRRERSLAWTDGALLDDASAVGLARVMSAAAARMETNAGPLMDTWLRRFATTAHSERAGPAQLAVALARSVEQGGLGADPSTWDLDAAPFKTTGVHNRTDLQGSADGGVHCGELRVSLACTDAIVRPFHMLALFRQPALAGDVDAAGTLTCAATWLRWAELSDLDGAPFLAAARALLDDALTAERFLMIETVELTVSPWEWRQWSPSEGSDGTVTLENPPLFQQLDVARVNATGPVREDFLAFVAANADALRARTLALPVRFRSPSARVVQGAPWVALDLGALDDGDAIDGGGGGGDAGASALRQNIELVGCTACHTADADFVQTREDRTFSPFYSKELAARAVLLDAVMHHRARTIPFGPLQEAPVLPP